MEEPGSREFQVTAKLVDAVELLAEKVAALNETLAAAIAFRATDRPASQTQQSKEPE